MISAGGTFLDTVREDGASTATPTGQATLCGRYRLQAVSYSGVRLARVHVHVAEAEPSDWPVGEVLSARGRCWRRDFLGHDNHGHTVFIVSKLEVASI